MPFIKNVRRALLGQPRQVSSPAFALMQWPTRPVATAKLPKQSMAVVRWWLLSWVAFHDGPLVLSNRLFLHPYGQLVKIGMELPYTGAIYQMLE